MTTFFNTTIPLGEMKAGGLMREVDAQSHELPVGRGDVWPPGADSGTKT